MAEQTTTRDDLDAAELAERFTGVFTGMTTATRYAVLSALAAAQAGVGGRLVVELPRANGAARATFVGGDAPVELVALRT